jgi:branched-chain amino acid transport system ATP-binding protein
MSVAPEQLVSTDPVLRIRELKLRFGGLHALNDVSFDLYRNEVVGLIGPNGAGKTALLNCLTGFYAPRSGSITFEGTPLVGRNTVAIAGLGIGRTFQHAASLHQVGARDIMLLGRERFLPRGVLRFASPLVRTAEREAVNAVLAIAEELGILEPVRDNLLLDELPYGILKLVDIGRALCAEPTLLLMDEPAAGLNRAEKDRMAAVIAHIGQQRGITQVVVDHDIDWVSAICDRLVVLSAGRKIAEGSITEVLNMPEVIASYIGTGLDEERHQ